MSFGGVRGEECGVETLLMSRPTKSLWCCACRSREVSAAGDLVVVEGHWCLSTPATLLALSGVRNFAVVTTRAGEVHPPRRAAHSHSDRSSSATPLSLGLRATPSSCSCCCLYLREDRREEDERLPSREAVLKAEHHTDAMGMGQARVEDAGHEGMRGLSLWSA